MAEVRVERLDHLGLIAGVIKDLRIIEMIDERIEPDEREHITTGEAIAGMIINGLGFSNRPASLTPSFLRTSRWRPSSEKACVRIISIGSS